MKSTNSVPGKAFHITFLVVIVLGVAIGAYLYSNGFRLFYYWKTGVINE